MLMNQMDRTVLEKLLYENLVGYYSDRGDNPIPQTNRSASIYRLV